MQAVWTKDEKQLWGDLKIDQKCLVFNKGEWPFRKKVWKKPYHLIKNIGQVDAELRFIPAFGLGADYPLRIVLRDMSIEVFILKNPGYLPARNFVQKLYNKIQASKKSLRV